MEASVEKTRSYNIQKLWGRAKEIVRLFASGVYTQVEIAKILGVTAQTVNNVLNSALGKQMLAILDGAADAEAIDLFAQYKALAPVALALQTNMMMDETTSNALKNAIADKIQDRAGYMPVNRNLNVNLNGELTKDDVAKIKDRAAELRALQEEK
jgi:predicted transcriptional regulator